MQAFNEYHAEKAAIDLSIGEAHSGGDWTYTVVCAGHHAKQCPDAYELDTNCVLWNIKINDERGQFVAWW